MQEKDLLKVFDLLQIKEITTDRQKKNGTRVFKLPMNAYIGKKWEEPLILATYKSGYVRRLLSNSGAMGGANCYQLNKRYEGEPEYYKSYKWENGEQVWDGKYNRYTTRKCVLLPDEVDRLEYLLNYAIKNWYCKPQVQTKTVKEAYLQEVSVNIDGQKYVVQRHEQINN